MPNTKNPDFDSFVKRQQELANEAAKNQVSFDPERELQTWLDRLNGLYSQITEFLKDYVSAGSVSTDIADIEISEEFIGRYSAPQMTIRIGLQEIKLVPIGTMLIGAKGRVDVIGRAGNSRLILINKSALTPNQLFKVTIVDPKNPPAPTHADSRQVQWAWKIVSRPPAMKFIELNKDSFLEMILEVSNA